MCMLLVMVTDVNTAIATANCTYVDIDPTHLALPGYQLTYPTPTLDVSPSPSPPGYMD